MVFYSAATLLAVVLPTHDVTLDHPPQLPLRPSTHAHLFLTRGVLHLAHHLELETTLLLPVLTIDSLSEKEHQLFVLFAEMLHFLLHLLHLLPLSLSAVSRDFSIPLQSVLLFVFTRQCYSSQASNEGNPRTSSAKTASPASPHQRRAPVRENRFGWAESSTA